MTPRDRRPDNEQGPVNWGIMPKRAPRQKSASTRPGGSGRLEIVRSGNNPAPTASTASGAGSADVVTSTGEAGDADGDAMMTEEDLRSAAALAIASGTADAVDEAIAIDLADVGGDDTGWAGSALSAASPGSPVPGASMGLARGRVTRDGGAADAENADQYGAADYPDADTPDGADDADDAVNETAVDDDAESGHPADTVEVADESEGNAQPVPTAYPVASTGNSSGAANVSAATAMSGQDGVAAGGAVNENRPRPVVRPTAVDGPSAPQTATTTTRVFTISQGRPTAVPTSPPNTSSGNGDDSLTTAPPPPAPAVASAPAPGAASATGGYGYQVRPGSSNEGEAPRNAVTDPEEDAGILAESSAWEAATNALDTEEIRAQGGGTDWGVGRGPVKGRGPRRLSSGTDWGVGRGPAKSPAARTRSPWPAAVRRQRLCGVAFALTGLLLATVSAMNLARNAEAGHLWIPPWLVAVLGGAGLVAAAGYLAWAGGTPLRREAERWRPGVLDAAAGLTTGTIRVNDPARLVARARGPIPPGASERGDETSPTVDSGPKPVMGTSTVDQSAHAPAGVAGAVGGFMLASSVICAVVALILGPSWLIATGALALGGIVAIRLAGEWLGQV